MPWSLQLLEMLSKNPDSAFLLFLSSLIEPVGAGVSDPTSSEMSAWEVVSEGSRY